MIVYFGNHMSSHFLCFGCSKQRHTKFMTVEGTGNNPLRCTLDHVSFHAVFLPYHLTSSEFRCTGRSIGTAGAVLYRRQCRVPKV